MPVRRPLKSLLILLVFESLVAAPTGARDDAPKPAQPPPLQRPTWPGAGNGASLHLDRSSIISRLAFGSCFKMDFPVGVWDVIGGKHPQLFLWMGDVIYKDTLDMDEKRAEFTKLGALPEFARFRKAAEVQAVWDDHDYGANDGGADYPMRVASKRIFLEFFAEPPDSPRWREGGGIYGAATFGPPGKRLQVILLDGRYHRSRLDRDDLGGYHPMRDPKATFLGEAQWHWLEDRLKEPAELRLICSGIQVIAEDQPNEKWANLPLERDRLFKLIGQTRAAGVVLLSGDRHHGEISALDAQDSGGAGYPLYDVTSSGMNCPHKPWEEPNAHRVGDLLCTDNFGWIEIDWDKPDPLVSLMVCEGHGDPKLRQDVPLSRLHPGPGR
jgi:alkaline phosphatase D